MLALGIDIGGTRLKAGVVDETGRMLSANSAATPTSGLIDLQQALSSLLANVLQQEHKLAGVGIGCRGIINWRDSTVERLPGAMKYLEGTRLADLVRPVLGDNLAVFADNDARTALAGEVLFGAARGRKNALLLTLGTGVGGAVLADGQILRGSHGVAGHVGHLTVDPYGPVCICGNRGCLELYFSARAIESEALAAIHRGCHTLLQGHSQRDKAISCEAVFKTAATGDGIAQGILHRAMVYLSAAVAGIVHVLDPEVVIVGGNVLTAGGPLWNSLVEELETRTKGLIGTVVPVVPMVTADRSAVVGAAALALSGNSQRPSAEHARSGS